jgi:hypothetical protein
VPPLARPLRRPHSGRAKIPPRGNDSAPLPRSDRGGLPPLPLSRSPRVRRWQAWQCCRDAPRPVVGPDGRDQGRLGPLGARDFIPKCGFVDPSDEERRQPLLVGAPSCRQCSVDGSQRPDTTLPPPLLRSTNPKRDNLAVVNQSQCCRRNSEQRTVPNLAGKYKSCGGGEGCHGFGEALHP